MSTSNARRAAVIGSGFGGLAAAIRLQASGVDLVQFTVEPLREQFQIPVANVYLHGSRLTS